MSPKKLLIGFALVVLVGGGTWLMFKPAAPPPVAYTFAAVEEGPIVAAVSTSGTLQAAGSVTVGSQLSGQISEVLVDYNDSVRKGDLLARIDPKTFEARVRQNLASLEVAKARVAESEAARRRAELNLAEARRDFERRSALRASGNLSERDFDTARTRLATAEVDLQQTEAQLLNARAAVLQQEAALNQAQIDLERTYIRSPIDGVVIKREIEPGQTVQASMTAPTLFILAANLTEMEVEARVDEADIGRVELGQPVRFTVDAFPGRTFQGKVQQIQKAPKEVQSVVTYTVVISAANPEERLLPGLTAKLEIVMGERERATKVPAQALRFRPRLDPEAPGQPRAGDGGRQGPPDGPRRERPTEGEGTVWILGEDGKPQPIALKLGLADPDWVEVLDGPLKAGQQLIVRADRQGQRPAQGGPRPGMRF